MLTRSKNIDDSLVAVRPEDRPWGLALHAIGWIPVWGFVFTAMVWLHFKNRSREMIFHVQQVIQYQIIVLIPLVVWVISSILISLIGTLSPSIGGVLQTINTFILSLVLTASACLAIYGGVRVYLGKSFLYPVIGHRVLEGSINKFTEE